MPGGGGNTTTVQNADPWGPSQPYRIRGFEQALQNLQSGGPQFYPGQTYVPFSGQTEAALGGMENRAMYGSPVEGSMQNWVTNTLNNPIGGQQRDFLSGLMGQGPQSFSGYDVKGNLTSGLGADVQSQLSRTLQGDYLNSNPYLDKTYDRALEGVLPGLNATFGGAGRSGSGVHAMSAGKASSDLANQIYGGNYQMERGRMMQAAGMGSQDDLARRNMDQNAYQFNQNLGLGAAGELNRLAGIQGTIQQGAAGMAPTAAGLDWQNLDRLASVGGAREGQAGRELQDSMDRWNWEQGAPDRNLANYIAAIQGNFGGTTTTEQQGADGNPYMSALGGGLGGAWALPQLFSGLGAGPAGLIGAGAMMLPYLWS